MLEVVTLHKDFISCRKSLYQNIYVVTVGHIEICHVFKNLLMFANYTPVISLNLSIFFCLFCKENTFKVFSLASGLAKHIVRRT